MGGIFPVGMAVILLLVIACILGGERDRPGLNTAQWYVDGTLHRSSVGEWRRATEANHRLPRLPTLNWNWTQVPQNGGFRGRMQRTTALVRGSNRHILKTTDLCLDGV